MRRKLRGTWSSTVTALLQMRPWCRCKEKQRVILAQELTPQWGGQQEEHARTKQEKTVPKGKAKYPGGVQNRK